MGDGDLGESGKMIGAMRTGVRVGSRGGVRGMSASRPAVAVEFEHVAAVLVREPERVLVHVHRHATAHLAACIGLH